MCGIAGQLRFDGASVDGLLVRDMCDAIVHRGPDDSGYYVNGAIGLGSRRLSIVDVAGGHQPVTNEDATVWVVFNGEIYNFRELRKGLCERGHTLSTQSDTEVIVHLYEDFGVDCVKYLNGMFSFALWDVSRHRLFIARDRVGEKPLVYALDERRLTFASEISAVRVDGTVPRTVELSALDLYLKYMYVSGERTMLKSIRRLPPGSYLLCEDNHVTIKRYWDVNFRPDYGLSEPDAVAQVRSLLEDSVRRRLIADVSIVPFLAVELIRA